MVFCDLDGTLIDKNGNIICLVYSYLIKHYRRRYIITGRSKTSLQNINNLSMIMENFENFIFCYNGNAILDWGKDTLCILNCICKSNSKVEELFNQDIDFVVDYGENVYSSTKSSALRYAIYNGVPRSKIKFGKNPNAEDALLFHIYCDVDELEIVKKIFSDEEIRYDFWPKYLVVYPHFTDKANGIKFFLKSNNIKDCIITTIGNDYNDIGMTRFADCGIALSNSPALLKESADIILTLDT